jgi:RNA polymerase sigma-70 factor, ECF subfamily
MTHAARPAARYDPDAQLLDRLRSGDERAFMMLVQRYRPSMMRLAVGYVPSQAVAEEVVQEAWLGFLNGISRFEGRSSVRTWLFRILINRARTTGMKERRTTSVGDLTATVDASRFGVAGNWAAPPQPWTDLVEDRLAAQAMAKAIRAAMADLPVRQREVVTLRDVEGLSSEEVCGVLEITEANQRVLLHRGRSRLRQMLESDFGRA